MKILLNFHEEVFDEENMFEGVYNLYTMVLVRI